MNLLNTRIEARRVFLLPVSRDHAEEIFRSFTPQITRYMNPRPAQAIDETLEFIDESRKEIADGTNLPLSVICKQTGAFVGCAGLHDIGANDRELGIWIKQASQGHGYGHEAITAVIEWARSNLQFEYLRYPVDKRNLPSRKIAERNGGVIRKEYRKMSQSGFELDEVEYWIYK